jgi:sugar phosphate isomerase/epimerase
MPKKGRTLKPLAVQLWSLREEAANDFPAVLKRVADIGYAGVEPAGMHGHDPREIGKLIADLGMEVPAIHVSTPNSENLAEIVEEAQALGAKYVVGGYSPLYGETDEAWRETAVRFRQAGEMLEPYGLSFAFHNHWFEFAPYGDGFMYDMLLAEAPNVSSELDVYWAAVGGADPIELLRRYKSHIPLLHARDGMLKEERSMVAVGSGVLPIPEIIRAADSDVLQWLVVEIDDGEGDMFEAVEESYRYLTSMGLAQGTK